MKCIYSIAVFLLIAFSSAAQQGNNVAFGTSGGLNFSTDPPTQFTSSTNSSILNHCLIQYGGYGYYSGYWSILYCHNTSLTISNSEISNSSNYGIYLVSSANLNIVNNTISNNNQDGIYCASQSTPKISGNTITNNFNGIVCEQSNPVFVKDNTFTNNKNYAVYMSSSISTFTGNKGAGNTYNGIGISGTLPTNATALFHLILVI